MMIWILFFKKSYCPPTMTGHTQISTSVVHTKQVLSTLQETVADVPLFPFQFPFAFKCHFPVYESVHLPGGYVHFLSLLLFLSLFFPADTFLNVRYLQGRKGGGRWRGKKRGWSRINIQVVNRPITTSRTNDMFKSAGQVDSAMAIIRQNKCMVAWMNFWFGCSSKDNAGYNLIAF